MQMNLMFSVDIRIICVQCGKELVIEGQKVMNPTPTLKCPDCGVRIQVQQGPRVQIPPGQDKRFPPLKLRRA